MGLRLCDIGRDGALVRTETVVVEGVGEFVIHEFTAGEFWKVSDRVKDNDKNPMTEEEIAAAVVRIIEGQNYVPEESDIQRILDNLGKGTIEQIFLAWLELNRRNENPDETAKEL